ncbi:MAG: cysteate synthase [Spirochaetia bacterium]
MQDSASDYLLECPLCGGRYEDSPEEFLLSCPEPHPPALLRATYRVTKFVTHPEHTGVFRFFDWLPIRRKLPGAAGPVAFHSTALGPSLGLENLFIIFNGWWPEKSALMETCTFKELEAQAVCGRILDGWRSSLVVSSAGNTARAFHSACSRYKVPALLVVPCASMPLLWSTGESNRDVRLAVLDGGADYADAIELGNGIAATEGFYPEGGARNAARRDGMGTALLSAVEASGRIPDHYFQAVGSGTGAIAAWEMNLRLQGDGRFGHGKMRLHLSQNAPFTPMTDAWEAGSRVLSPGADGRRLSRAVRARVLANRNPPYSIAGGLFDALTDTRGCMYRVSNAEACAAGRLFEKLEGCDIDPAAEVACASLVQAAAMGRIGRRDTVALNITGGGHRRLRRDRRIAFLRPQATFTLKTLRREGPARGLALLRAALT